MYHGVSSQTYNHSIEDQQLCTMVSAVRPTTTVLRTSSYVPQALESRLQPQHYEPAVMYRRYWNQAYNHSIMSQQ